MKRENLKANNVFIIISLKSISIQYGYKYIKKIRLLERITSNQNLNQMNGFVNLKFNLIHLR